MFQTMPADLEDFSGGVTDFPIDAAPNQAHVCDNLLITPNNKLRTVGGSELYSAASPQLPVGNVRIRDLKRFNENLVAIAENKIYLFRNDAWEAPQVEGASDPLPSSLLEDEFTSTDEWNDHLLICNDRYTRPLKMFIDGTDTLKCLTAGLPLVDTKNASATFAAGGGVAYLYAFHYYYTYSVGDVIYEDYGPASYFRVDDASAIGTSYDVIINDANLTEGNSFSLENGPHDRYDTASTKIRIYRTLADGDTLYLLDEVDSDIHQYSDNTPDADIENNTILYIEGGVLNNDAPPMSKYLHVANNACYYANVKNDSGNVLSYRLLQSVVGDPDSVPMGNYLDLDEEITGVSSYADRVLVFTRGASHRVEGIYDELGLGGMSSETIDNTIGCVSHRSIVQIPQGVVFADEDGFAFTDGFKLFRINEHLVNRYKALSTTAKQRSRIYGTYDKENKRVYWSVQMGESDTADNDLIFILDLKQGISERSAFVTMSGGTQRTQDFVPTAITFFDKQLIRGDSRGYVFKHDEDFLTNPIVDTSLDPSLWGTSAIIYKWVSVASSLGNKKLRKFTPKMIASFENASNLSLQIASINDLSKRTLVKELRFRGNFKWGDPLFTWGDETFVWGSPAFIQQQRHFSSKALRCTYKQIELTNANTIVANSDGVSTVLADKGAKTLTIENPASAWPTDLLTYAIAFEADGYEREFPIIDRASNSEITIQDPTGAMPEGAGVKWVMKGYAKGEVMSLLSLTVLYAYLGATQDRFSPDSEGGNVT